MRFSRGPALRPGLQVQYPVGRAGRHTVPALSARWRWSAPIGGACLGGAVSKGGVREYRSRPDPMALKQRGEWSDAWADSSRRGITRGRLGGSAAVRAACRIPFPRASRRGWSSRSGPSRGGDAGMKDGSSRTARPARRPKRRSAEAAGLCSPPKLTLLNGGAGYQPGWAALVKLIWLRITNKQGGGFGRCTIPEPRRVRRRGNR